MKRLNQVLCRLLVAILLILCALMLYIAGLGLHDKEGRADVVIVPGNTVYADGQLSARLKARLDKAVSLYQQACCKAILVSGAVGIEGQDEALAMKKYLLTQGIPEAAILLDQQGYTSWDTAKNAKAIMTKYAYRDVVIVSQFFHIARMQIALAKYGLISQGHAHANYFEARDSYSLLRECLAYLSYRFRQAE